MTTKRVAIYARLSKAGEERDLERQLRVCRKRAGNEGWDVVEEFVDNGTSAWKPNVKRPRYEEMLASGEEVLAYNADRLFRQDKDRLRFYEVYTGRGNRVVRFADGMDADLGTADGRKYFRDLGSAAEHQSDRASERITLAMDQLTREGRRWGGRRPFGYGDLSAYGDQKMRVDRREASAIRKGAEMILEGGNAHQVAVAWNAAGTLTPSGRRWRVEDVKRVLSSALIAGVRESRKDGARYPGTWPAIVSEEQHQALRSLLINGKGRRAAGQLARKHLLSGILQCGECAAAMHGRTQPDGRRGYACSSANTGCGRVAVGANAAEDHVLDAVHAADKSYGRKRRMTPQPGVDLEALARIAEQRATLQKAAELGAQVGDALARLDDEERGVRSAVKAPTRATDPELDDAGRRERRHRGELTEAEVLQSQAWVRAWVERVVVRRAKHTREQASERLTISWR